MRRLVLAILAVAVGIAGPAPTAGGQVPPPSAGSIGIRLLEAPADAHDDPRAQVHIVDHLSPGTVITRRIEVSNTTGAPLPSALYAAAASITDGTFTGAEGRTQNDVSSWVAVDPPEVVITAGGTAVATVTIAVPSDAAPGEQYAVVWAEARSAPAGAGIAQVSRVGLRIYLSVGPGGAPAPDFTIETLTAGRASDGAPRVLAMVRNTGGRALDLAGTLELSDGPGGVRAGPFPASLGTTLGLGAGAPVAIELDGDLPPGPWLATMTLRSGRTERTASATITFPVAGSTAEAEATTKDGGGSTTGAVALVVGAALLVALSILDLRRRWRSRSTGTPDGPLAGTLRSGSALRGYRVGSRDPLPSSRGWGGTPRLRARRGR